MFMSVQVLEELAAPMLKHFFLVVPSLFPGFDPTLKGVGHQVPMRAKLGRVISSRVVGASTPGSHAMFLAKRECGLGPYAVSNERFHSNARLNNM